MLYVILVTCIGHYLWLLPPLLYPALLCYGISTVIARPPDHQPAGINARPSHIKILYRCDIIGAFLVGPEIPHLQWVIGSLLVRPLDHVGKLILYISRRGDVSPQPFILVKVRTLFL